MLTITEAKLKLQEYAEMKNRIKELEKEIKKRQPQILEILEAINPEEEDHKVQAEFGYFTVATRRTYTYSVDTQVLIEKVDSEKEREEQDGTAAYKENPYVKFNAPKSDKSEE